MTTVKDQVSMMFGIGVAEQLEEAGLLVRDPDPAQTHLSQHGVSATHWMARFTHDGITSLAPRNYGHTYYYPPHSLDHEVKSWIQGLKRQPPYQNHRRYEKVWTKQTTAQRSVTMVNNWGKPWGITAELVPVAFVEVT